jgi:multidrug efflux pump subunit AcrA (membrane-fusion protein)
MSAAVGAALLGAAQYTWGRPSQPQSGACFYKDPGFQGDYFCVRDGENQPFVYAEQSPNQFGMRPVTLGESLKGQTQITSGLKTGDRVIGDGSLFLQFANSLQR